jgi:hypothetical protein
VNQSETRELTIIEQHRLKNLERRIERRFDKVEKLEEAQRTLEIE